jgi:hypothetical protein
MALQNCIMSVLDYRRVMTGGLFRFALATIGTMQTRFTIWAAQQHLRLCMGLT